MTRDERRAAIVAAVFPLIQRHGAQVTTRQIAEAAGVAEGTIFRAFDSLQDVLEAVALDVLSPGRLSDFLAERPFTGRLADDVGLALDLVVEYYDRVSVGAAVGHAQNSGERAGCALDQLAHRHRELLAALADRFSMHVDQLATSPARFAQLVATLAMGMRRYPNFDVEPLPRQLAVATILHGAGRTE